MTEHAPWISATGWTWRRHPTTSFAVITVTHARIPATHGPEARTAHRYWFLFTCFTPGYRVRIGAPTTHWLHCEPGEVFLLPPGTPYWECSPDRSQAYDLAWILFIADESLGLNGYLHATRPYARIQDREHIIGQHLRDMARTAARARAEKYWDITPPFFQLMGMLFSSRRIADGLHEFSPSHVRTDQELFVERVETYLRANVQAHISTRDIARHLHTSVSNLCHRFRAATGETPMTTLRRFRIEAARTLLIAGVPVKDVAERTCFSDRYHFSRVFRALEGVPPATYLHQWHASSHDSHDA